MACLPKEFRLIDRGTTLASLHGTGHGIGSFLAVHEGPHGISSTNHVPLRPGHVVSNEPGAHLLSWFVSAKAYLLASRCPAGYYKEGHFGMRIESVLIVKKVKFASGKWLGFERVTQVNIRVLVRGGGAHVSKLPPPSFCRCPSQKSSWIGDFSQRKNANGLKHTTAPYETAFYPFCKKTRGRGIG
jgi:hypothetical protein